MGEPTTPSIQPGDLLIIGSGSGETASLVTMAQKAHKQGAKIATLTIYPEHTIGNIAETIIRIPGITAKSEHATSKAETIQPTGSSFEQLSWLIYDSVVIALKEKRRRLMHRCSVDTPTLNKSTLFYGLVESPDLLLGQGI